MHFYWNSFVRIFPTPPQNLINCVHNCNRFQIESSNGVMLEGAEDLLLPRSVLFAIPVSLKGGQKLYKSPSISPYRPCLGQKVCRNRMLKTEFEVNLLKAFFTLRSVNLVKVLREINETLYRIINPLKTKRRLLYLKTHFVPRSKHFSSRL